MLFLAKAVGRPVKWVDTRDGLSRTTVHCRGQNPARHAGRQPRRQDHRAFGVELRRPRRVPCDQRSRRATGADRPQHHRRVRDSRIRSTRLPGIREHRQPRPGARRRTHGSHAPDRAHGRDVCPRDRDGSGRSPPQEMRAARAVPLRQRPRVDLRLRQIRDGARSSACRWPATTRSRREEGGSARAGQTARHGHRLVHDHRRRRSLAPHGP